MDKIQKISGVMRWTVVLIAVVVISYLLYQQWVANTIVYFENHMLHELWESDQANNSLVALLLAPILMLMILSVYWILALLGQFQQGEFFSPLALRYYVAFIWTKVAGLLYKMLLGFVVAKWHDALFDSNLLIIQFEFGYLTTLILMGVVAYLLKAAKAIEDENKEFV
ncbi:MULTISPECIES: hypothetical protein [Pseudoalteromonas]|uniref:DUF2975 domain-containing protein n=1 Tax=Pseudoalteromonas amylolytica TaxID=1859457 RepID=A0A1S1MRC8_9GAMM|nr:MULTISPECIES: hypothetical protein [Pseudoalteromonas]MCF6437620.1 hypothetical protein [Pseudoalteromonas sp. MMG022]OHU86701.1 hypothetical protein BFC16_14440 [Pseudoalteromonas sp. JW3]OHU88775.1 hypothetical protein BET10_18315 [Pseudoalteromonas amylolytica]